MNYIEKMKYENNYMSLKRQELNEEVTAYIQKLKEEYITTFSEPHIYDALGFHEAAENEKHSKQSEILGKLVTLTHEYYGYKGVQEVIHELFWKYQELITVQMEAHEKTIRELREEE